MKTATGLILAGVLAPAILLSTPYYALRLHGGSHVYANDPPVRKGRLILFHRYPDGVYMSLSAAEVEEVVATEAPPKQPETAKLTPGKTVYIGSAVEGPGHQIQESSQQSQSDMSLSSDYGFVGYTGWGWGGSFPPPRPPVPPPFVPSRIGPNGFPIIAPAGSPGSVPPPIGSNGFPILAPQPPAASPRRP